MSNLRAFFLHLFLEEMSAVGWQRATGMQCSLSGHSLWCSAGDSRVPLGDFQSHRPPKKVPHLPSQVGGVEIPGQNKFEGILRCQSAGELRKQIVSAHSLFWLCSEDVSFSGTQVHPAGVTPGDKNIICLFFSWLLHDHHVWMWTLGS